MAITNWFGYCNANGSNKAAYTNGTGPIEWWGFNTYTTGFTCPGAGDTEWQVDELSIYVASRTGSGNIRLAVYDTGRNLICQGSGQEAVADVTNTWQGHTNGDGSDITWNSPNTHLVGGTTYLLIVTWDADNSFLFAYDNGSAGDTTYAFTDYTGGFPTSIAAGTNCGTTYSRVALRCGVEEIGGGESTPIPVTLSDSLIYG